jgi:hypothetical protein
VPSRTASYHSFYPYLVPFILTLTTTLHHLPNRYFHQPTFGLVDEGTSAVDVHSLDKLYADAKVHGITLVTIAHQEVNQARPTVHR